MKYGYEYWMGGEQSYPQYLNLQSGELQPTTEQRAGWVAEKAQQDEEQFGEYSHMIQQVGNTAVLSISGTLIPKGNWFTSWLGMTGYNEIHDALATIINEGSSTSIMLDIDSPGGSTRGLNDITATIKSVDEDFMPVMAHSSGQMASAAYRIGAAARGVYSTDMAEVGSIGAVAIHQEYTGAMKQAGITPTVIRSGKYKMLGSAVEKLSDLAKREIQADVDYIRDDFINEIASNMGLTPQHVMDTAGDGQVFFGQQALDIGLIDAIDSYEGVVKRLDDIHNSTYGGPAAPSQTGTHAMLRKRVTITAEAQAKLDAGLPLQTALASAPAADPVTPVPPAAEPTATAAVAEPTTPVPGVEEPALAAPAAVATDPVTPAEEPAATVDTSLLSAQLRDTQDQLVDTKVELRAAQTALETAQASLPGLSAIVGEAIQVKQIQLGFSASDISHLQGDALVTQYRQVEAQFKERFAIGATAETKVEDDRQPVTPAATAAAARATSFRKED